MLPRSGAVSNAERERGRERRGEEERREGGRGTPGERHAVKVSGRKREGARERGMMDKEPHCEGCLAASFEAKTHDRGRSSGRSEQEVSREDEKEN